MSTVLVVDDENEIRSSLRGVLNDEGLRVLEAEGGREALAIVRREHPELVLLDVWMPDIDGIELLRQLRSEPNRPQVVMISGHGNVETAVQATKLGAFDFIEKPFSIDSLLQVVNRALDHHAQDDENADSGAFAAANAYAGNGVRMHPERTIGRSVIASGHGLHTGVRSGLILYPLPPGRGIVFTNLSTGASVPAHLDFVESTGYATTLHQGDMSVATVEHLLATLHAYGITNVLVKVQSEVPVMDGSAREFCALIESAGVQEQGGGVEEIAVDHRIAVGSDDPEKEGIAIEPADMLSVSYTLKYPPPVGTQRYTFEYRGPESFREEVAPARTFGFVKDMKAMASMGLASGGRLDNCILIDDEKIVNTELRFPDELARHKILDVLGDLYLLGRPVRGKIDARMTGHADNIALLRKIAEAAQ
jgi:UDP-3-O-[3-hydroxymyristoyl] N-acetylglucosamine deacetylase